MNQMQPSVLVVGEKKAARALQKNSADVSRYTKPMHYSSGESGAAAGSALLNSKLLIVGESREYMNELCTSTLINSLLSSSPGVAKGAGKHFVSLHVSDQMTATHKRQLRLTFRLPPLRSKAGTREELTAAIVGVIPHLIDTVGRATLSKGVLQKAENSRAFAAAEAEKRRLAETAAAAAPQAQQSGAKAAGGKDLSAMTEKEREKYDKIKKKREQRKMMGKVKMVRG